MYSNCKNYRKDLHAALHGTINIEKLYHKKVLITGATGLIGSFLTDVLLYANKRKDAEIEVYALARSKERLVERFSSHMTDSRFHLVVQDITEPLKMSEPVDYMIHAAGDGYPAAFRERPVETMTPALFGTYNLLLYAKEHNIEKLLYISSGEIYGRASGEGQILKMQASKKYAFKEEDCGITDSMEPRSCYPMAKKCAETMCVSFAAEYMIPTVVARPSHTYGVCTSVNDNRATVQFLEKASVGEDIVLYSRGNQLRSYTYVADCVSGLLTVLLNGRNGEAYNIANSNSRVTIAEFADILVKKTGVKCIMEIPDEASQKEFTPIEYAVLDSSKLERLGWKSQYGIQAGIENMLRIKKELQQGEY